MPAPHGLKAIIEEYGDPRGRKNGKLTGKVSPEWVRANLVCIDVPWPAISTRPQGGMRDAYRPGRIIAKVWLHRKVADLWLDGMNQIWAFARNQVKFRQGCGRTTAEYDVLTYEWLVEHGLDLWGGSWVWRAMRGSAKLSTHAFGIAWDYDPARNALGTPGRMPGWWVRIWESLGCTWGGRWKRKDPMHVQVCSGY